MALPWSDHQLEIRSWLRTWEWHFWEYQNFFHVHQNSAAWQLQYNSNKPQCSTCLPFSHHLWLALLHFPSLKHPWVFHRPDIPPVFIWSAVLYALARSLGLWLELGWTLWVWQVACATSPFSPFLQFLMANIPGHQWKGKQMAARDLVRMHACCCISSYSK